MTLYSAEKPKKAMRIPPFNLILPQNAVKVNTAFCGNIVEDQSHITMLKWVIE